MASPFREALVRANEFLLKPPSAVPANGRRGRLQTEVAVLGLSAGCGVTTLARGLAICCPSALVSEVASTEFAPGRVVAHRADVVVLVAGAGSEPALADLAAHMLREDFGRIVLVANRVTDASRWNGRPDLCVPESRLGAAFLGRGWRPAGAFGSALTQLADLVEEQ